MYIATAGIPGDGRCLFRSVVHGACIRSGKPIPNEDLQRKLADELRAMVCLGCFLMAVKLLMNDHAKFLYV
jgi:hypothetical protein